MENSAKVTVGITGSQFEADIHAASFQIVPEEAEVVAVAWPTERYAEVLRTVTGFAGPFVTIVKC